MQNALTGLMLRVMILMIGSLMGLVISMVASFDVFQTTVTVFLSMITWFLVNFLNTEQATI